LLGEPSRSTFGIILVVAVVVLFVVKDLLAVAFSWWQTGFITVKRIELSENLLRGVMDESFADFRHRNVAETLRTLSTAVGQAFNTVNALISIIATGLTVLAILGALLVATPVQALLAIVYFGIAALAYLRVIRPRISRVGESIVEGSKESTIAALQALQGFKEVKLRGTADFFTGRFVRGMRQGEFAAREGNFFSAITRYLLEILFILGVGALLLVSFSSGDATQAVGSLALFVAAGFRLLPNISGMVGAINSFRMGRAALALVAEEQQRVVAPGDEGGDGGVQEPVAFTEEIRLEDVHFGYRDADLEVLRGIDLRIPRGGSIALVGSSGAGKTTLVDLILGLLQPTKGRILVDGVDVAGHVVEWQRRCAMIAQDVFIAEDTVRKNVLFDISPEDADEDALGESIRRAQLQDVVDSLPGGLDADVGDWGARLSGGQRQRIGIARALYRRPSLLVLDEATSALDNETERRITETIGALHGETTVIVVAHRLSTVKNVDTVVFMEDGLISGAGSFDELRESNRGFAHLVQLGDLSRGRGMSPAHAQAEMLDPLASADGSTS
jgi:ABC-type multidrug transport system fused ATPase/permease subunit